MEKLANMLFHGLKVAAALFLVAMIVMVFGNVVLRFTINSGITVSEELSSWGLTFMTYTAGLVALREHGHLGFDAVLKRLPALAQRVFLSVSQLVMIALMGLFLQGSWQQTVINIGNAAPASGISMGVLYAVGVFFSAIAILILLSDLYYIVNGKIKNGELVLTGSEAAEAIAEVERNMRDTSSKR